jgi:hypothetical protein
MIDLDTILNLVKSRMKRVLEFGEMALPPEKFQRFRKLVLDEFGRSGLETELERVFHEQHEAGHGQANTARKGG